MERGNGNTVLLTVIGVATLLVALVGATFAYFTANASSTSSQSLSITTAQPIALEIEDVGAAIALENAIPGAKSSTDTPGVDGENRTGQQGFTVTHPGSAGDYKQSYDLKLVVDSDSFVTTCRTGKATADIKNSSNETVIANGNNYTCESSETYATEVTNAFNDQLELTIAQTSTGVATASTLKLSASTAEGSGIVSAAKDGSGEEIANAVVYNLTNGSSVNGHTYVLVNDQQIQPGEKHSYMMTLEFKEINLNQSANAATNENPGKSFTGHLVVDDVKVLSNTGA